MARVLVRVKSWVSVDREVTPSFTTTGITAVLGMREMIEMFLK